MKVAVVFDPDPDLGSDPLDDAHQPRRLGEFLDSDKLDVVVMWREIGEQFDGGSRTHLLSSGIWENVTLEQMADALEALYPRVDEAET